jgi:hypothetical protein
MAGAGDYSLSKLAESAEFLHFFSPLFIEQTFIPSLLIFHRDIHTSRLSYSPQ